MNRRRLRELTGFYENELCANILPFWLERCHDEKNGGYFNCFDNLGRHLVSRDKYTWSQGRFVWMWSKLAASTCSTFTQKQRSEFLKLARSGRDFLYNHCLAGKDDYRCVFLMDETGTPKVIEGYDRLDMSIYADCFVMAAFARYAQAADDIQSYHFAKKLYQSALARLKDGNYSTFPYILPSRYRAHGIPMIFTNVTAELYYSATSFDPEYLPALKENLQFFSDDVLGNFVDKDNVLHEVITADNRFFTRPLGWHVNPGHVLEDMWFQAEAADILGRKNLIEKLVEITRKTLVTGWDYEYGGILHFCAPGGGAPQESQEIDGEEPMFKQLQEGWGDKLWWVHSEALYTTLLFYYKTSDPVFLEWHDRIADYTFEKFPNPDKEIREWVQILRRDGTPQEKVVALPVKDPYHITRNLVMIIELLSLIRNRSTV
ncbi:MAG: hypothetical protein GX754_01455 [Clostridiaceae bacterium]|nr:hypothetical protein [Clostridiaceae bacterium]